ncbi:MAG: hypothetical protein ACYDGN_16880 [Acidimicrobiales bacterium]
MRAGFDNGDRGDGMPNSRGTAKTAKSLEATLWEVADKMRGNSVRDRGRGGGSGQMAGDIDLHGLTEVERDAVVALAQRG